MNNPSITYSGGLLDLDKVILDPPRAQRLNEACARCTGSAPWQQRKQVEFRNFLRLTMLTDRLRLVEADLEVELRLVFSLHTQIPCTPDRDGRLRLAPFAIIGLRYPEQAVREPQPGYGFVQILAPREVFHSNISIETQQLCLGTRMPSGIRLTELLLLTYGALSLQSIALDLLDPGGVLNPAAAYYYQQNPKLVPLSREPFLRTL